MFDPGADGKAWQGGRVAPCTLPDFAPRFSFAFVAVVPSAEIRHFSHSGTVHTATNVAAHVLEMDLPTDRPGLALRCRLEASPQDLPRLKRYLQQTANFRSSVLAIGGMVLLLAVCGWIVGGTEGLRRAVAGGLPRSNGPAISGDNMYRWFGARLLRPMDMPGLFKILSEVCRRAQLSRLPDLYLARRHDMNAYALGDSEGAAIVLTDGLLRGMTQDEIAGILAHEVAHIRNNDAWAMGSAAALHQAIEWTSLSGLALLRAQNDGKAAGPLVTLLAVAPILGRLLCMALSRVRELDADATALEFTGDSRGLIAALAKLEHHHNGAKIPTTPSFEDGSARLLRSHPATCERVSTLRAFSH
ncbi:MAG TPA: M48 family metalloprotease [Bradyrhizobium sp.]|nr:M48 family metalloprotease [Bradyrhizobium sp.]